MVSVSIANKLKPLPLLAFGVAAFRGLDENGDIEIKVEVSASTQPEWVRKSSIPDASTWAGAWLG